MGDFCKIIANVTGNNKLVGVSTNSPTLKGTQVNLLRFVQNNSKPVEFEDPFRLGSGFSLNDPVRSRNNVTIQQVRISNMGVTISAIVFDQLDLAGGCMLVEFVFPYAEEGCGTYD